MWKKTQTNCIFSRLYSFVIHQSPVGLHDIVNVVTNTAVEVFKCYRI